MVSIQQVVFAYSESQVKGENCYYIENMLNDAKYSDEYRNGCLLSYIYEDYSLVGFNYLGVNYFYERDDFTDSVIGIYDESGCYVARYEYVDQKAYVYKKSETGQWIIADQNENYFIGNINLIRRNGYRYNQKDDCYEFAGTVLDLSDESSQESHSKNLLLSYADFMSSNMIVARGIEQGIDAWANYLYTSSEFRRSISYSSGWYSSLADVEILSRLIYAENTSYFLDQEGITWVLVNRRDNTSFPNTLRGVAIQSGQFASITSNATNTNHARNPQQTTGWRNAIWLACAILTTSLQSDYMWLFGKPTLISNQLYFTASNYFYNNCRDYNNKLQYKMSGTYVNVSDAAILGHSDLITTRDMVSQRKRSDRNLFFNI